MKLQLRKLNTLGQGIRGLQAKLHVLREESDRALEESDDAPELGSSLMAQYESIGGDLQDLIHDWESGKAALTLAIDKKEKRLSQASNGPMSPTFPMSPTLSLGGLTSVSESPSEALQILNSGSEHQSQSSVSGSSSEEEIFEAVGIPARPARSTLSREERIAKMKDERQRQSEAREKRDINTSMLKELETVINLRPRGRQGTRITSI